MMDMEVNGKNIRVKLEDNSSAEAVKAGVTGAFLTVLVLMAITIRFPPADGHGLSP